MQNSILFKLLPGMFEVQTNFWNSTLPISPTHPLCNTIMLWCTKNRLLKLDSMLGAIFFELPGDVFSTIIDSKSLQRISHLSLHHGMEFLKILEYLSFFFATSIPMSFVKRHQ